MERLDPEAFELLEYTKQEKAARVDNWKEKTRERLEMREAVALARRKFNKERFNHAL